MKEFLRASVPRCVVIVTLAVSVAVVQIATAAESSLLEAVERGDRAAALRLLAGGADPNAPGPDGTTAIMWAAAADDLELVVEPWDDEAWARGAASLLLGELFQPALRPDEAHRPSLTARA